jgi:hypothetical protein
MVAVVSLSLVNTHKAAAATRQIPDAPITYEITVELDPETRGLDGHETITWTNTSDQTVATIPMHLYLNAFSNEGSSWYRYKNGSRFSVDAILERFDDPWGWTEPESIRQGDQELQWQPIAPDDGNTLDRTLVEVTLDQSVAPGETLVLEIDWNGRLPAAAARTGGHTNFFFVAQWFPKIAGLQPEGDFNRHQFFGLTEFFANFADFDVSIRVPAGWGIAATGSDEAGQSDDEWDWHRYRQKGVIDFAFATGANMEDAVTRHELVTGGSVDIHIFQQRGFAHQVPRWTKAVAASLDVMSERVMPYPYATVTAVMPPRTGLRTLGMEYPTFFTGFVGGSIWDNPTFETLRINEFVIAHEFAHQYFHGLVATNEFEDAFMDEGMTEYWATEIILDTRGEESGIGTILGRSLGASMRAVDSHPTRSKQPAVWSGPSFLMRGYSSGSQFYRRPAATFRTAAKLFSQNLVDQVFAEYARRWAFEHPRVEDFWAIAEEIAGQEFAALLREAYVQTEKPDYKVTKVESSEYAPPRGYIHDGDDVVLVGVDWDGSPQLGLASASKENGGIMLVEILDSGFTRETRTMGGIEQRQVAPEQGEADTSFVAEEDVYFVSNARIEGPDWDNLPVTVELRFADGVIIRDAWDGRGLFREYRMVRAAPLNSVIIDPERNIFLDMVPVNNGLSREPSGAIADDWSRWLSSVYQLLAEGASSWL